MIELLERLGAIVATGRHNAKSSIIDAINIHENILHLPLRGSIVLSKPEIANLKTDVDSGQLKGHRLSANTIRNSVPAFSLQIYSNPCLYWLVRPAFVILAAKNTIANASLVDIFFNLRNIFSAEFAFEMNNGQKEKVFHIEPPSSSF